MTFRQKQRVAGVIGAMGGVLLLVSVAGWVARSVSTSPVSVPRTSGAEERSQVPQGISPEPVEAPRGMTDAGSEIAAAEPERVSSDTVDVPAPPELATPALPSDDAAPASEGGVHGREVELAYYPLAVGRYWVYRYHERDSDVVTQVERQITRRERRQGASDLYFFADGTIAYVEEGKIYEMGSNGGVNIVPASPESNRDPIRYRSQGLQIEKWLARSDTAVVIDGHRFEQCLEVVTRFRPADKIDGTAVSYSSFYAPGIGLVGRQQWPRTASGALAVTLSEYGTRTSPSIADGQL